MTPLQRIFAITASIATFAVIIELVRRRKLREEYSFLWIVTAVTMLLLSAWYELLERLTALIGAVMVTTTLFLFALLFLLLISVHYSTVLSQLTQQVRRLTQELAILAAERDDARRNPPRAPPHGGG
jgi:hypothetical protein